MSIIQEKKRKVEGYICHSHLSEDAGEDFHFDSVGVDETHVDVAGFTAQEVGGRTKQTKHRIRIMHLNLKESERERKERDERKRGEKKGNEKKKYQFLELINEGLAGGEIVEGWQERCIR